MASHIAKAQKELLTLTTSPAVVLSGNRGKVITALAAVCEVRRSFGLLCQAVARMAEGDPLTPEQLDLLNHWISDLEEQ